MITPAKARELAKAFSPVHAVPEQFRHVIESQIKAAANNGKLHLGLDVTRNDYATEIQAWLESVGYKCRVVTHDDQRNPQDYAKQLVISWSE